jgi:hypothetical protein
LRRSAALSVGLGLPLSGRAAPAPEAGPKVTPEAAKAVEAGLALLAQGQHADGSFGTNAYKGNTAVTGLAGLALLAAGHKPGVGPQGAAILKALDFILAQEQQQPPGFLHNAAASPHGPMYCHGYATLFLSRLQGKAPKEKAERLAGTLARAVLLIVAAQSPQGGWRYTPNSQDADISVTACEMLALRGARDAGLMVPKRTLEQAVAFVKQCQDAQTGGFRYMPQGGGPAFSRAALGLDALECGGAADSPEFAKGLAYLLQNRPAVRANLPDIHYFSSHLHAGRVLAVRGGKDWEKWYADVAKELAGLQRQDGAWPDSICTHYGTAVACIVLQMPLGHLWGK